MKAAVRIPAPRTRAATLARVALCALLAALSPLAARAQLLLDEPPAELKGIDVAEKRGNSMPLDLQLIDENGNAVRLGDYFDGQRPVVLLLAYYTCPMLCNMMLGDVQRIVQQQKWELGKDYRVVVLSFDHRNTVADAQVKREIFAHGVDLEKAGKALLGAGYAKGTPQADPAPFLLATEQNARLAADSVGFNYRFLDKTGEYAHPSVITILSPAGSVSNYMYGRYASQYDATQVRLALADASAGRLGSAFEKVIFWCYHYDPNRGTYTLQATRVMKLGGGAITVGLVTGLGLLFWNDRTRRRGRLERARIGAGVMG